MEILHKWLDRNSVWVKRVLNAVGYDYRHWTRPVMYSQCTAMLQPLQPAKLDALEISAGQYWQTLGFKSFTAADYPEFDICKNVLAEQYDLIIADQVFEHVLWPYRATRNVFSMLKPGGHFLVTTPFLIRVHAIPHDCTRWTETGIRHFLNECGFPMDGIQTGSWGNRSCVKANFSKWARKGWLGSLRNEPDFPVVVWALATKGQGEAPTWETTTAEVVTLTK